LAEKIVFSYDSQGRSDTTTVQTWNTATNSFITSRVESNTFDIEGRVATVTTQSIVAGALVTTGVIAYKYDAQGRQKRVLSRGTGFTPANANDYENVSEYEYDSFGRGQNKGVVSERNAKKGAKKGAIHLLTRVVFFIKLRRFEFLERLKCHGQREQKCLIRMRFAWCMPFKGVCGERSWRGAMRFLAETLTTAASGSDGDWRFSHRSSASTY
jgi:hypothetical protein